MPLTAWTDIEMLADKMVTSYAGSRTPNVRETFECFQSARGSAFTQVGEQQVEEVCNSVGF